MIRFLILICCVTHVLAQTMNFKETRYIEALEQTLIKKGVIEFTADSVITSYENSEEKLIYSNKQLMIIMHEKKEIINLNKNRYIQYFFEILKAIYFEDITYLENYFTVLKKYDEVWLLPKDEVKKYIHKIVYKKSNKLDYLQIELLNQDRITIEQLNN